MNIFITSECPVESAKFLDTKRVSKMILESVQMLCTALRQHNCQDDRLYKATHVNHPANVWCRETRSNYLWLLNHAKALHKELKRRRGTDHKSGQLFDLLGGYAYYVPKGKLTPFVNCAANKSLGVDYKHVEDATMAYRLYLSDRWDLDKREPTWR